MIFALNNSLSEAFVLAERAGLDRSTAYEVFAASAAGAPYIGYKRDAFLNPDDTPVAFSLDLALKDLDLILGLADRLGVPMDQARVNRQLFRMAAAELGGDGDMSSLASHIRERMREGATT
jgi:3-hydroxyisobutyrate dehydrogenase-like beta-hydroxyacid dehydrogenase